MSIKTRRNITYDTTIVYPEEAEVYDYKSFTIATATTDYDVKAQQATFVSIPTARFIEIKTDQPITIKFNAITNPGVVLTTAEGKLTIEPNKERLAITNIYITTTIINTNIKLFMT